MCINEGIMKYVHTELMEMTPLISIQRKLIPLEIHREKGVIATQFLKTLKS
jgi:hypothetical protein